MEVQFYGLLLYEMSFMLIPSLCNILLRSLLHSSNGDSYSKEINPQALSLIPVFQDYFSPIDIHLTNPVFLCHRLQFQETIHDKEFSLQDNLSLDQQMLLHLFLILPETLETLASRQNPAINHKNVPLLYTILHFLHPPIYPQYH